MLSHTFSGLAVRQERERQRKSVAWLAEKSRLSLKHVYALEVGSKQPGYETAGRIADALGKPIDDFLTPITPEQKPSEQVA